jgi:putative FmdB family regulatory protein
MPIYEYRCSSCGHELEALQKFSDAPLVTCPACGAAALQKQVSAAGFQLKGSGWYVTDFRGGAKPGKTEGGNASENAKGTDVPPAGDAKDSKGDTASTTKTDAKSDTKSDTSISAAPAKTGTTPAAT